MRALLKRPLLFALRQGQPILIKYKYTFDKSECMNHKELQDRCKMLEDLVDGLEHECEELNETIEGLQSTVSGLQRELDEVRMERDALGCGSGYSPLDDENGADIGDY